MDPRIARETMTDERRVQAKLTAISILKAYGKGRAVRRGKEIATGTRNLSNGNKLFYDRVSELVKEGVEDGTVDGEKVVWR